MKQLSAHQVIDWGIEFLQKAELEITAEELKEQKKYAILIQNPNDKTLLSKMLDESSQIHNNRKLARRMKLLIKRYGVPGFFNKTDAFLFRLFAEVGYLFDFVSIPIFKKRLRGDTSKVIINEKASFLNRHLSGRYKQQIGQNVNLLGEVVLGDGEANRRYEHYLEALKDPNINYISIKISGIYAQINALNYQQNKIDLCRLLAAIYKQAMDYEFVNEKGEKSHKFVNLDMEEYKDMELTFDVFKTVLSYPEFKNYSAGIVVQAYLPDAYLLQSELLEFAKKRYADGGAPLKMRLVKGANLQMESIVASLRGWENPVLDSKVKVDANYMHILDRALLPENAEALHIGVASHNFFTIGYAYLLSLQNGVEQYVTFEMLEGMANHLPRVMRNLGKQIILYTPVVKDEHFLNAVSYLVRRLDENTGEDNFLSYSFNLKVDSEQWNFLKNQFEQAFALKDNIQAAAKHSQNRLTGEIDKPEFTDKKDFRNEQDTNFDLAANRVWADNIRKEWQKSTSTKPYIIPLQIGDNEVVSEKQYSYFDRSQDDEICVCKTSLSNLDQVKEIVRIAESDKSAWRKTTVEKRLEILNAAADNLQAGRGNLIGCMAAITGKTFFEGDVEVSEAIDFCRFYPLSMAKFAKMETVRISPKGIVLVVPPWNFPLAIPVGGVAAALSGGNSVILKPATTALPVAWEFAKYFWAAGVPKDALQVVCTDGREPLNYLTSHQSIKHIILTGGTDTAFHLLANNPTTPLSAETGGKNAIIVTASADRDHAIQNIITSAFSNAGQKCSACSLLILEKEVYNDPNFKTKLIDAVSSLHTGSAWIGGNYVGAMISNENEKLQHAINNLDDGEYWLVKPEFADKRHFMLKPCVKWGVKAGSYSFVNELFAPVLSVVCANNLEHAIQLANSSQYGLTAGLQSLDESEQQHWKDTIEAGNLYINRGITGAIVNRQPFGGMKRSAFGGGIKAGGQNYVTCFVNIEGKTNDIETATNSYFQSYADEFSVERDINNIYGEQNTFRYLPLKRMLFRIQQNDNLNNIKMVIQAAKVCKTPLYISIESNNPKLAEIKQLAEKDKILLHSQSEFIAAMKNYERIRTCSPDLPLEIYKQAAQLGLYIATAAPLAEGRLELLHYLKEQSIAFEYHRYGSITEKII
ncbi:MAG: bifunctional proline dehydrogenase/L-glutamate gamma-semialdehyde dehydrogenase [Paludibacter sp.]|jgi:RHH-type proline utilization regulon transcriptional repressor/proline dehydrogenase/delta 1-pyrroline-5-carboxylate dehydrogenase|nr:bifunctional proline dehydrogenase/L-glutamate gamma-semialdehyde dehydrogenase [Paludibacter sp.]